MQKTSQILITGSSGVIGTALVSYLYKNGFTRVLTPKSNELDLTNLDATLNYFKLYKPEYVFHLAGRIYGIMGNMKNKGKSFYENTLMNIHVVEAARVIGVKKILGMGTVAIYPDPPVQLPNFERDIWSGSPHSSEDSYAHSKRALLAQLIAYKESYNLDFVYPVSTNLYGPNDRFSSENGHVIPSLIKKFYEAKKNGTRVTIWGSGEPERDFLYSADAARGLVILMEKGEGAINLASGEVSRIRIVVEILAHYTGLTDKVDWDTSKPNGQILRSYNTKVLKDLNFFPEYSLDRGLKETFDWYSNNQDKIRC